jgi:hypothetical protein
VGEEGKEKEKNEGNNDRRATTKGAEVRFGRGTRGGEKDGEKDGEKEGKKEGRKEGRKERKKEGKKGSAAKGRLSLSLLLHPAHTYPKHIAPGLLATTFTENKNIAIAQRQFIILPVAWKHHRFTVVLAP